MPLVLTYYAKIDEYKRLIMKLLLYFLAFCIWIILAFTITHTCTLHTHTQPVDSSPSPIQNPQQEAYQTRMASSLATNQSAASSLNDQLKRSSLGGSGGGDGGSSDSGSASYQPHHQRLVHRYT